jgi:hypothetical protein
MPLKGSRKNLSLIAGISILLIVSLASSLFSIVAQSETRYERLWNGSVKVIYGELNEGWWLKGYTALNWSNAWTATADALMFAVNNQGKFKEVFCGIFGNSYNNTIFIVLTDNSEDIENEILKCLSPPPNTAVKFLKGFAPLYKLEEWLKLIDTDEFVQNGLPWTGLSITENGTILITLEKVTTEYVGKISELLNGNVPPGILVIAEQPLVQECSQSDRIRPLKAGIKIQSFINDTTMTTSTMNFVCINKNNDTKGIIMAGHATREYYYVYQPTYPDDNNKIGHTTWNKIKARYSDAAWVPLYSGVTGTSQIYDPNLTIYVKGQIDYANQYVGEMVESLGLTSGYRYGYIKQKFPSISSQTYGTLYNQLKANFTSASGDSGAPVYQQYYEGGMHDSLAFGIFWGTTSGASYYSPPDGIERDFGVDLDFAGA